MFWQEGCCLWNSADVTSGMPQQNSTKFCSPHAFFGWPRCCQYPPAQTCAGCECERNAGLINSSLIFPALQAKGRSLSSLPDTAGLSQHSQPSPAKPQLPFLWDLGKRALSFSLPSNQGERPWLIQKINTNRGRDKGVSLGQLLLCECLSCPPQAFLKILSIPGRLDFLPTSGFLPCFGFTSQNLTRIWRCGRGRRGKQQQRGAGVAPGSCGDVESLWHPSTGQSSPSWASQEQKEV